MFLDAIAGALIGSSVASFVYWAYNNYIMVEDPLSTKTETNKYCHAKWIIVNINADISDLVYYKNAKIYIHYIYWYCSITKIMAWPCYPIIATFLNNLQSYKYLIIKYKINIVY